MPKDTVIFEGYAFDGINSHIEVVEFEGEKVLKVTKDLKKIPFNIDNMESTIDEPTYAKIIDMDFENGAIEAKIFSQIQKPQVFKNSRGFIGIAYRISQDDSIFECIYIRPTNGVSENQIMRNHTVQYFSYPDYKFETLRKKQEGKYESWAPVALNEWIDVRIEVNNEKAELFVNNLKYSCLIVNKMLGINKKGAIALFVDVDTIGYFKNIKIIRK